jgi:hypothetical protein
MLRWALRLLYVIMSASTDGGGVWDPDGLNTSPPAQTDRGSGWDPLG